MLRLSCPSRRRLPRTPHYGGLREFEGHFAQFRSCLWSSGTARSRGPNWSQVSPDINHRNCGSFRVSIFAEAPVPAPQLLAYAQALGPIFVGLGTLAVSFMTYLLARRQRELAEQQQQIAADKLATDLFDRRLAAIRGAA